VLLLVGCGSSAQGAQATATTPATATPLSTPPTPPNCPPVAPGAFPTGVYKGIFVNSRLLTFQPNGKLIEEREGASGVECYLVTGQHLLIFGVDCNDTATHYGDYIWAFDGTRLRLSLVQDHCNGRASNLGTGDWIKQPGT
jgi:hypothetical protein